MGRGDTRKALCGGDKTCIILRRGVPTSVGTHLNVASALSPLVTMKIEDITFNVA